MNGLHARWDDAPTRRVIVFLFTLGVLITAKGQVLIPGYALDDYLAIESHVSRSQFIAQGRVTQLLLFEILRLLNIPATQVYWPSALVLFVAFAASIEAGIFYIARSRGSVATHCIVGGIIAAHPYFTEYLTFRQALLPMFVAFGGLYIFLASVNQLKYAEASTPARKHRLRVFGIIGLISTLGAFQNVYPIALIIVLAAIVADTSDHVPHDAMSALKLNKDAIAMAIAAAVVYAIVFVAFRSAFGAAGEQRAELISWGAVPGRLVEIQVLLNKLFWSGEPLTSLLTKLTMLAVLLGYWAIGIKTRSTPIVAIGAFLPLAISLSLALILLGKVWWPVPRAIFPVGYAVAFALLLLGLRANSIPMSLKIVSGAAIFLLSLHSAAILNDQWRLNRWDLNKAARITDEIARIPGVSNRTRIVIVGGTWYHSTRLRTTDGDLNASAFLTPWSLKGLLREAGGIDWQDVVTAAAHPACGDQKWPAAGSISAIDGAVLVCL